jgi:hypothetical protein
LRLRPARRYSKIMVRLHLSAARVFALGALAAGLLILAPAAQGRTAAALTVNVTFFTNGSMTVTLPDGTPVGAPSGTPTVIPAGYYTMVLTGPGGCTVLPHFDMQGPGMHVHDNMTEGEVANSSFGVYFQPSATYVWTDEAVPGVVNTFKTSSDIQGTAPNQPATGFQAGKHGTAQSTNPLGSVQLKFRGTLSAAVSSTGKLTLLFKGKSVSSLTAGKYTIVVTDQSNKNGFAFRKIKRTVTVTGVAFVGKHTGKVSLSAGKWVFTPGVGSKTYALAVK